MPRYVVEQSTHQTPSILSLHLKKVEGEGLFSYQPGQYATVSFRRGWRSSAVRCFSIASAPTDQSRLEFGIRVGGKFTHALGRLNPGDYVDVSGPFGNFVLDPAFDADIVFCAGGIGITPFLSMMRYATALQQPTKITLLFGVLTEDDIPYVDELRTLAHTNPHLTIILIVDSGSIEHITPPLQAKTGRLTKELLNALFPERIIDQTYFICGPPPFMKGLSATLVSQGVPQSNIITEAFSQGPHRQTGRSRNWPTNIYVLGALGALASTVFVAASDMLKSIPSTILPKTLGTDERSTLSSRQSDIDALVQTLSTQSNHGNTSPAVTAARKEVADAETQIAAINAQNAETSNTPTTNYTSNTSSTNSSQSNTSNPAPTPAPTKQPVCTTSPSGVVTCR